MPYLKCGSTESHLMKLPSQGWHQQLHSSTSTCTADSSVLGCYAVTVGKWLLVTQYDQAELDPQK